jgi:cytochrome c oxidase accessory protein FixG
MRPPMGSQKINPECHIQPKSVRGFFRSIKWGILWITLGVYYILPWIRWNRGGGFPDQAVLFNFASGKFYFFGIELWAYEIYYITGLLILAALGLFLITALAGRVWCGYLCPQTVWTDLFIAVERFIEGDRNERLRLDKAPWSLEKLLKRGGKHILWFLIALATGGAFIFYFQDAPTLVKELCTVSASLQAWIFLGVFTATTYLLAGFAREQVCTHMCPWPRIQSALIDEHSLLVMYDEERGEPRGSLKQKRREDFSSTQGDCVDCGQCVVVCPQGIDIRQGFQLPCIQCALCIDACDDIMKKLSRPTGLIRYDTPASAHAKRSGVTSKIPFFRPRILLYSVAFIAISGLMVFTFLNRPSVMAYVWAERAPLFVKLSNGDLQNHLTVRITNRHLEEAHYILKIEPEGSLLELIAQPSQEIVVPADQEKAIQFSVKTPFFQGGSLEKTLKITDISHQEEISLPLTLKGPLP